MKTRSSPRAAADPTARVFRPERVPAPKSEAARAAAEDLRRRILDGETLDLEIGCGVGWHPILYARENPDRVLIAIERTAEKFAKFRERLARNPALPNLIPVHADAVAWITHSVPDGACERIFLLYPNPNPKNPQARWIRMPFFGHLLRKLRPGGQIEFRTNIPGYADEIGRAAGNWEMTVAEARRFTRADVHPEDARTHFERKYLARGETCFVLRVEAVPAIPRGTLR